MVLPLLWGLFRRVGSIDIIQAQCWLIDEPVDDEAGNAGYCLQRVGWGWENVGGESFVIYDASLRFVSNEFLIH